MTWDMTINIPLLLSLVGSAIAVIWRLSALLQEYKDNSKRLHERLDAAQEHLVSIDGKLDRVTASFAEHRAEDREVFGRLDVRLARIETRSEGEARRAKP